MWQALSSTVLLLDAVAPPHSGRVFLGRAVVQVIAEATGVSLRVLVNVFNLFLISFVIFALAGVSLYQNSLKRQCVLPQGAWKAVEERPSVTPLRLSQQQNGKPCANFQYAITA